MTYHKETRLETGPKQKRNSAGGGADAHEGTDDGVLNVSVSVEGGGVDWDLVARRRDRNGFDVFFLGGSSDGSSRASCLRFSRVGGIGCNVYHRCCLT